MEKEAQKEICYRCGILSSTQEHVPPKCLFPEIKDTKGLNFRRNLIKVPSCELHNTGKSDDDEFLLLSLSGIITNNIVGQFHFLTKSNRAIRRKSKDYINKQVLRNHQIKNIKISETEFRPISIGIPNVERLKICFENIAYGLYYHEFKKRFIGEANIFIGFLDYSDENMQSFKYLIKKRFDLEKDLKLPVKGDNHSVFTFEFQSADKYGLISLKLTFYGKTEVFIAFKPQNTVIPDDLTSLLIQNGMETVVTIENEEFIFNKKNSR